MGGGASTSTVRRSRGGRGGAVRSQWVRLNDFSGCGRQLHMARVRWGVHRAAAVRSAHFAGDSGLAAHEKHADGLCPLCSHGL